MWNRHISGTEQLIRIVVALALFGFSSQEHTSLIQAIAGYLAGGIILLTAWVSRCAPRKLLE